MSDVGERSAPARRGVRWALAQVALAGLVGAVIAPVGSVMLVAGLFGGWPVLAVMVVGFAVVLTGALAAVALVVPGEARLCGRRGGRVGWALLVGGAGYALWLLGWAVGDELGWGLSRSSSVWVPAGVVPFALVAGLLLRRWYLSLGSLAVLAGVGLFVLDAVAATMPSDREQRLSAAPPYELYVADVPGYHPETNRTTWELRPDDPGPPTPPVHVTLHALEDTVPTAPDCLPVTYEGQDPCEQEQPGLSYVKGEREHTYYHRVRGVRIALTAPQSVDRAALRQSVLAVRWVEPEGTVVTDVPGYSVSYASAAGTSFLPNDRTLLPGARDIGFTTQPVTGTQPGGCLPEEKACEVESPSLRFVRSEVDHQYVRVVGTTEVRVRGGMAVGRDVLRAAVLAAHPATEADLSRILPAAQWPKPEPSVLGAVREVARSLFGR
ncbi:hypothetical protein AB0I60_02310 [Actinosynnema sp. NPDC050436]|uniref:hypothetical protein n=1 Tax=Actinosynnema sp. NPDC050436 TaxID=3155659 RepID=UPI0033CEDB32